MLFSKKFTSAVLCAMLLSIAQSAGAYGLTWIDKDYDFAKIGKILCLPIVENAPFSADKNLLKECKRVKTEFVPAYGLALDTSLEKAELGKLIQAKTGANAFLVTEIITNADQIDYVEGKYFPVTMHEYVEVSGPEGTFKERERYYDTNYYYPAHEVNLHKLEVDFHIYDATTGKKIFSFNDVRRSYDHNQESQFKDIAKDFFVSLRDTPKLAEKTRNRNIVMDTVQMNGKINDIDKGQRAFYIMEGLYSELFLAGTKVKNVLFPNKGESAYALKANVFDYYDAPYWTEPSVTTSEKLVRSWSETIRVRQDPPQVKMVPQYKVQGNAPWAVNPAPVNKAPEPPKPTYKEVTIEHRLYNTEVNEFPGGYKFKANVALNAQLIDRKTGAVVFNYKNTKSNDKRADAWVELTKDFYKKLAKEVKK